MSAKRLLTHARMRDCSNIITITSTTQKKQHLKWTVAQVPHQISEKRNAVVGFVAGWHTNMTFIFGHMHTHWPPYQPVTTTPATAAATAAPSAPLCRGMPREFRCVLRGALIDLTTKVSAGANVNPMHARHDTHHTCSHTGASPPPCVR